jgi:hypothetical protein
VRLPVLASLLALLLGGSVWYEATRTPPNPGRPAARPCLLVSRVSDLPGGVAQGRRTITDGDDAPRHGAATFWSVAGGGTQLTVVRVQDGGGLERLHVTLPRAASPGVTTYDVGTWAGERALFALRQTRRAIGVTVVGLRGSHRVLLRASAPQPVQARGARRDLAIARLGGNRPDLFVIDRAGATAALTVYSGESSFRRPLVRRRAVGALGGLSSRAWSLDVGHVAPGTPVVAAFRAAGGSRTRLAEVHLLEASGRFDRFLLHAVMASDVSRAASFALGPSQTGPSVYAFVRRRHLPSRLLAVPATVAPQVDPGCG